MVQETEAPPPSAERDTAPEVIELTPADVPEMSVLYTATRPGRALCPKIQKLGQFLGIREEGKLVAMGGLRLHLAGYREITTVATMPGHEGRGYATAIVMASDCTHSCRWEQALSYRRHGQHARHRNLSPPGIQGANAALLADHPPATAVVGYCLPLKVSAKIVMLKIVRVREEAMRTANSLLHCSRPPSCLSPTFI